MKLSPQAPITENFSLSLLFSPLSFSSISPPLPLSGSFPRFMAMLYPESIDRREYTPDNPNCWETFQIPLDVCFRFKYRRAFKLGRSYPSLSKYIENKSHVIKSCKFRQYLYPMPTSYHDFCNAAPWWIQTFVDFFCHHTAVINMHLIFPSR